MPKSLVHHLDYYMKEYKLMNYRFKVRLEKSNNAVIDVFLDLFSSMIHWFYYWHRKLYKCHVITL